MRQYADGACVVWCLLQAEVAVYIIAQAIPMIRILAFGSGLDLGNTEDAGVATVGTVEEVTTELVVLRSGKVVPADSNEARAEMSVTTAGPATGEPAAGGPVSADPNDPVHKMYEELGLSKRAWSKSPSTSPVAAPVVHHRGISDVSDAPGRR